MARRAWHLLPKAPSEWDDSVSLMASDVLALTEEKPDIYKTARGLSNRRMMPMRRATGEPQRRRHNSSLDLLI
jgi:hypothetical protein